MNAANGESVEVAGQVLIEIYGQFDQEHVRIDWQPTRRRNTTDKELEERILLTWKHVTRENPTIFPGQLCRLLAAEVTENNLILRLGQTDYRELTGTNLSAVSWIKARHPADYNNYLSNGSGICCAAITSDNQLLIQKRSNTVSSPGDYHVPGGHIDPSQASHTTNGIPNPFLAMCEELAEPGEIGMEFGKHYHMLACLGIVRNRISLKPEIVFETHLDLNAAQVVDLAHTQSSDLVEYDQLAMVPDTPETIRHFIDQHSAQIVPVGLGCILLHGRRSFGEQWYRRMIATLSS